MSAPHANGQLGPSANFHPKSGARPVKGMRNSIRAVRNARAVSRIALAEALGVPPWKMQGYERAFAGSIPKPVLKRIAGLLGSTVEEISKVPEAAPKPDNLPAVASGHNAGQDEKPHRQQKGQLLKLGIAFTVEGQYMAAGTIHIDTKVMHPLLKKALRDALAD